ncbi:hypothetical protein [Terrabacter sp. Root181]|uniref:hypothetical protein n=1 Tax=Terrabacter sp. Root181 TaxID=1736484 RepID=UPI0007003DBB|nr:hypothetical protein [Terrabacter sp. Root181]KRB45003.1 hypothetical protein ASD90_15015 [Terrabacter sp. Root181]
MSHRYDRTGERIDDEPQVSVSDVVRHVLAIALQAAPALCPLCGGLVRPGWTVHPSCAKATDE